jgi:hypothetical protein
VPAGGQWVVQAVNAETAPVRPVQVAGHQVPAAAGADQSVRLDVAPAVLSGPVDVAEAQPLTIAAGQSQQRQHGRLHHRGTGGQRHRRGQQCLDPTA